MKLIFTIFLLLVGLGSAVGQEKAGAYHNSPVFVQIGVGLLPMGDPFCAELHAAFGYRIGKQTGIGAEVRAIHSGTISTSTSGIGIGLIAHGQTRGGWYGSLGAGTIIAGDYFSDDFGYYTYDSGGIYGSLDLGHQLPWGLTIGTYVSVAGGLDFKYVEYDLDTDTYVDNGEIYQRGILSLGLKVGYAFPGRPRKR